MDDGVERRPFLEEDVDELVRDKSWGCFNGLINASMGDGRRRGCQSLSGNARKRPSLLFEFFCENI